MSSNELANLLSKNFIARTDVKAIQHTGGAYTPHTRKVGEELERLPWTRPDLIAHIEGEKTFGHYFLNQDSKCKLFMFDIDINKSGVLPDAVMPGTSAPGSDPWASDEDIQAWERSAFTECTDLRAAWRDRANPGRPWLKQQLRRMAHRLVNVISTDLQLPCAVAYSGSKGLHVYAFTGLISGYEAYEAAGIVLDTVGDFETTQGKYFFKHKNTDVWDGFPSIGIEVFPKQDTLKEEKSLGNLVRLPLGRNLKNPKDPTFFVDMTSAMADLKPLDPVWALTDGLKNPFKRPGE